MVILMAVDAKVYLSRPTCRLKLKFCDASLTTETDVFIVVALHRITSAAWPRVVVQD